MLNACFIVSKQQIKFNFFNALYCEMNLNQRIKLPIDELEPLITKSLESHQTLILQAPPGSGKTTRVPQFLLKERTGKILILEPRRLAARLSAERVVEELGQPMGCDVGFQIRYEKVMGPKTRCLFMTEGLFLRTLLANPTLTDVDTIVLDEFHERHLHSDVAFALTRWLQSTIRPDLKLILMSATLDSEKLIEKIPDAQFLKADVPTFPVEIEYELSTDDRPLEWRVAVAVESLLQDHRCPGDILVFLAGAAEIRRSAQALLSSKQKEGFEIFELRADLPIVEQKRIFEPSLKRKVILSTNVAETSVTLPGVTGVVDSGFAKSANFAHWNGLPTLEIKPVSQASCIQRSGRAGRTSPGVARRLFTRAEFLSRPSFDKPELLRADLAQTILEILSATQKLMPSHRTMSFPSLPWLEIPPTENIDSAFALLKELGAIDSNDKLTHIGQSISQFPLNPRLGRILFEAKERGTLTENCLLVSLLNEGLLTKKNAPEADIHTDCDLVFQASLFNRLKHNPESISRAERERIDPAQFKKIDKSFDSLVHLTQAKKQNLRYDSATVIEASPFAHELLCGFPDRIIGLRKPKSSQKTNTEAIFARGGLGQLSRSSTVQDSNFAIALQAEHSRRPGSVHFITEVTVAAGLNTNIIKEHMSDKIRTENHLFWDEQSERVKASAQILFESLVLEEQQTQVNLVDAEPILFQQLKSRWPKPFLSQKPLDYFEQRMSLLRKKYSSVVPFEIQGDDFDIFLIHICEGKKSFAEILEHDLQHYIDSFIPWELKSLLDRELPTRLLLGSGHKTEVHYVNGQPPWISSRIQNFFGTLSTPRLMQNSLPVTAHLLAPNNQAVQVTTDLAGFWKNVYPDVKKELSRRYPRHYWPDDPAQAEPLNRRPRPSQRPADTSRSK